MPLVVVCGALANKPGNGGAAWTRLSWALGLERLNSRVFFVEQISAAACVDAAGASCEPGRSINLAYFKHVMSLFGLEERSALVADNGAAAAGPSLSELADLADSADLLLNISSNLTM